MTVDFNDYFWGEKNNGFDVLYHNMKFGLVASKELSEFFREKSSIEEQNSKMMSKLAHKAGTGTLNSTFAPVWTILRTSAEKLSTLHMQMVQKLSELVKDVGKYADELHKKHKSVKEEESQTLECVQAMQTSTAAVQKSRDLYTGKVLELEKLRRENSSTKDVEKIESKLKKLQEEYKVLLEKHNPIKTEFERRMSQTCRKFQEIEEVHLRQMKEFLSTYLELLQNNHDMVGQVHSDFKRHFLDMSVDKLLEQFVLNKYTGLEKPEIADLDFIPLSVQQHQQQMPSTKVNPQSTLVGTSTTASATSNSSSITNLQQRSAVGEQNKSRDETIASSGVNTNVDNDKAKDGPTSRGASPELTSTTTTTSVKSNIRNWFSSSIPSAKNSQSSSNTPTIGASTISINTTNRSTSGNFGMDSNGSSIKNCLNTDLQSQDNQGSFMSPALTQLSEQSTTSIPNQQHEEHKQKLQHHHQVTGLQQSSSNIEQRQQQHHENKNSSRRTTSLLNIFASNAQVSGILRSRRDKAKTKKAKKKKELDATESLKEKRIQNDEHLGTEIEDNSKKAQSVGGSGNIATHVPSSTNTVAQVEVDDDGYSLQPLKEIAWEENTENAGSFYTDSDTDSDNDKSDKKIHVKIKPLNNGAAPMSASVDELRATVGNISLSPTGVFSSQQLQQLNVTSRQQSPELSNASTPTATVHPYAPLQSPTLSVSNNSRYADLGDIFSEIGEMSSSAPASATLSKSNSRQIPTPTSVGSIAIPRPPSRRSEITPRGRVSPSPMPRTDSIGSLEFRTAIGIGSSRGPSPLTIGISDTIPLAVAFHEIIHAYFRGSDESRCQIKISGDMMLSFPAGIANLLANNPNPAKLGFRIKNVQNLENIIPNNKLVQIDKNLSSSFYTMLEFNMPSLTALLRRQWEHNPSAAYFNVDILKYQVRTKPGASSCPFQLVSYWKCETTFTALKIDYKYNNHAMANASPLLNVTISVPVNGSVRNVQSKPHSAWLGESSRLVWNFTDISQNSQDGGVGTLRARLELNDGPSMPSILNAQFNCEGTTLSGIEFELHGNGYRLSLVKRRFVSGKYICEGDGIRSGATPTPPSVGSSSPFSAKSN